MPRKPLIISDSHYYHITGRSNNKENFYLDQSEIWKIMIFELRLLQTTYAIQISAFVLMSNHFHLLILTPHEPIDRIMYFFMKNITLKIQKKSKRINKIFGGRYKGSIIEEESYLLNVFKYILRNPLVVGLTSKIQDYPFSTANPNTRLPFKLSKLFDEIHRADFLYWCNKSFETDEIESIKGGLMKTKFSYKKERFTGRQIAPPVPYL